RGGEGGAGRKAGQGRPEPLPDRAELEADDAATNDDEVLRDLGDDERADVGEDAALIALEEGELDWYGAGGNDHVFCLVGGDFFCGGGPRSTDRFDLDDVPRPQRPSPPGPRDLVLPEDEFDSPGF